MADDGMQYGMDELGNVHYSALLATHCEWLRPRVFTNLSFIIWPIHYGMVVSTGI